jgi:hypothetical protein
VAKADSVLIPVATWAIFLAKCLAVVAAAVGVANVAARNAEVILKPHSHSTSPMPLMALQRRCISLLKQCARVVKVLAHVLAPHLKHVHNVAGVEQSIRIRECFLFPHRARAVKEKGPLLSIHVVHAAGRAANIVHVK